MEPYHFSEARAPDPSRFSPHLAGSLALLKDAPAVVAESTLALLPYAARRELVALGVVRGGPTEGSAAADLHVTEYGRTLLSGS
jgi:hypothetical protein